MLKNTDKGNSSTNTNAIEKKTVSQKSKIKHDVTNTRGGNTKYLSVNKNIEEIAKKISDHGESIYINWKNKGLAPTEILNIANDQVDFLKETDFLKLPLTNYDSSQFNELDMLVDEAKQQNLVLGLKSQSPKKTSGVLDAALQKFESKNENASKSSKKLSSMLDDNEKNSKDSKDSDKVNEKSASTTKNSDVCKCRSGTNKSKKKKDQSKTNGATDNSNNLETLLSAISIPETSSTTSSPITESSSGTTNVSNEVIMPSTIASAPTVPTSASAKSLHVPHSIKTKMKKAAAADTNGDTENGGSNGSEDTKSSNKKPIKPNLKKNSNSITCNPVRPFLTRGSVAERVMMFEKCPEIKNPLMRPFNRNVSLKFSVFHFQFSIFTISKVRFYRLSNRFIYLTIASAETYTILFIFIRKKKKNRIVNFVIFSKIFFINFISLFKCFTFFFC